jgi:hypothetical protein
MTSFVLNNGNNNYLKIEGDGFKTVNVNSDNLKLGDSGYLKVELEPTPVQFEYVNATKNIDTINSSNFMVVSNGGSVSGNKLSDPTLNLYINHKLDINPLTTNVFVGPRRVNYQDNLNIFVNTKENPVFDQLPSYLMSAVPSYTNQKFNVSKVDGLIPSIGSNYVYDRREDLFFVLVEYSKQLNGPQFNATGPIIHRIPYYATRSDVESALGDLLKTDRYCQRWSDHHHDDDDVVLNALNMPVKFTIDPRFASQSLNLDQSINVNCDIAYVKADDFDENHVSHAIIKKIHQSFRANVNGSYVTDIATNSLMSTNTISLVNHNGSNAMNSTDFVGTLPTQYTTLVKPTNKIIMNDNLLVFVGANASNSNTVLYSEMSFNDFVINPVSNISFTTMPLYNKIGAFYTVYVYDVSKRITYPLGAELLSANAGGSVFKDKNSNQIRYFKFCVKSPKRLVMWEAESPADEQVYLNTSVLKMVKSGNSYVVSPLDYTVHYKELNTVPGRNGITCEVCLKSNKNVKLSLLKQNNNQNYVYVNDSLTFDILGLKNVYNFNIINASPFDVNVTGDSTLFEDLNPTYGTYGVFSDNQDVIKSQNMGVCMRQAFNPNLWDIKLLDFSGNNDELLSSAYDL